MRGWARLAAFLAVAAAPALFVVAPLASFLLLSLFRVEGGAIVAEPSLGNYRAFLGSWTYLGTYLGTLMLCAGVTALCVLLGYPVAWFVSRQRGRARTLLMLLVAVPLFMSYVVKLYTLRAVLGLNGLLNGALLGLGLVEAPSRALLFNQGAVLATMVVIYLPFVILPVVLSLERIPRSLLSASADLGAGAGATFRRVVLPLSLPGTVGGALFAFVLALGDFVTPQMVGGPTGFTIGRAIWSQFGVAYDWPFGAAMGAVVLLTALGAIALAAAALGRQRV